MKILKLQSENVKRITVLEVVPGDNSVVKIGGKNGAGKSSAIDSISYVLGGEKMCPAQPIRTGESEAKIVADLGDYIVTRRFSREHLPCDCQRNNLRVDEAGTPAHHPECASLTKFGETRSTLTVTNRDGAKYPSPQAMLDKLYNKLSFDPLAFATEESKRQNEILRRIVGLDFTEIDSQRKAASDRRTMAKRTQAVAEARLAGLPTHAGVPAIEVSMEEVRQEMQRVEELRKVADEATHAANNVNSALSEKQRLLREQGKAVAALRAQLEAAEQSYGETNNSITLLESDAIAKGAAAVQARQDLPDVTLLTTRMTDIEETNKQIRANAVAKAEAEVVASLMQQVEDEDALVKAADEQKSTLLREAQFPIAGLGLTDDGVTFGGLPLEQASSSEQLRVSLAIGLALNPTLKVLLIRNGNLLDDDSLQLVAEHAEAAGAQVWMEFVTSEGNGMTVMMEDGHAKP